MILLDDNGDTITREAQLELDKDNRKQEEKQNEIPIIDRIININKKGFIGRWFAKRKISKELDKLAPSVNDMRWMIATIDMISILFFYDNNPKKSPIATEHLNPKPQKQIRGIFLNASKSVKSEPINCLICNISEYTRIRILICNRIIKILVENQKGEERIKYEFDSDDAQSVIKDKYDEQFFINLENELMNRYKKLILSCIK